MSESCNKCGRVLPPEGKCPCTPCVQMPPRPLELKGTKCCMFYRLDIPAELANDEETPPTNGAHCNALVVYAATGNKYLYDSAGIPTPLSGGEGSGTNNFNRLNNRPKYGGEVMTSATDIPDWTSTIESISSDLSNIPTYIAGLGYQTAEQVAATIQGDLVNYYTKTQVDNKIALIPQFTIEVVEELPSEDISETTIYLVQGSGTTYQEWVYADGQWVQLGTQTIDLSNYYNKAETTALVNNALSNYYTKPQIDAMLANYQLAANAVNLIMSTTDIGEGADLPANTIYGVYE